MRSVIQVIAPLLFVLTFSVGGPAAATEKRFALVIGNAGYQSKTLVPLKNPANDAVLVSDSLKKAGFEVVRVVDADLRAMKRAVKTFTGKLTEAGDGAIGLFYYSGHGFQAGGVNYLAPLKADLQDEVDAEFEALSVDWVLARLEKAHKGVNVVILDACRNTALTRGMGDAGQGLALLRATPSGSFISFATAPGSTALDGAGLNSPYTAAIAEEIIRPGISIEQAFKNVRRAVVAATGGDQVPWDHSSLTSDVVFIPTADIIAAQGQSSGASTGLSATQVEIQLWNDVKDSGSISQLQAYLDKFPKGAFAIVANTRIASLQQQGAGDLAPAQIEQLFAKLTSRSLFVEKPTRPHEFYSNARLHELQGDYPKARQDYLKFFAFGQPHVDPHYRFQNFLKIQEGRAGAREVYASLSQGRRDRTLQFVSALLQEREQRVTQLDAFIKDNDEFAPAYYELSRDFSLSRLGQQSLADKKREYALLSRFQALVEDGKFLRYFIDQQLAARQIEDAKTRMAALSFLDQTALKNPVKLNATRSNQGWMLNVSIADQATEIFIAKPGEPPTSTGFVQGAMHPVTGKPIPYPAFELPPNAEPMTLKVSYLDVRGEEQGPFEVSFDPALALVAGQKMILDRFSNGWVTFRDWDGKLLAYFTHLVSYRCAIAEARYGVDTDNPDTVFPLAECDPLNPHSVNAGGKTSKIHITVPKKTKYMSVMLTYRDGTQSDIKRFDVLK